LRPGTLSSRFAFTSVITAAALALTVLSASQAQAQTVTEDECPYAMVWANYEDTGVLLDFSFMGESYKLRFSSDSGELLDIWASKEDLSMFNRFVGSRVEAIYHMKQTFNAVNSTCDSLLVFISMRKLR
jgi:hypothetical protein